MSPLSIGDLVAYLDRGGLPVDHRPGENGLSTLCQLCPGSVIWTEDLQRFVCSRPECPGHANPSLHADAFHFKCEASPGGFANGNGDGQRNGVVVVVPNRENTTADTTTDRYAGRVVDVNALLAKPPEPIPWRVHDVVADGTLTIISGESTAGKSWLAQALCTGVARGRAVAGLPCVKGSAVYIDAEMGPRMFVDQRLRPTGVKTAEFELIDAMGLDVSKPHDLS